MKISCCEYFQGYKNWMAEHGEEKEVPGLGLSNEQLLFLTFGQVSSIVRTVNQGV